MVDKDNGMFTSVEVFFATKSSTIPVRAEIRNMINFKGQEVFHSQLNIYIVNTSTDGTDYLFCVVYLHEDTEYCVILYSTHLIILHTFVN